jgi:hypothetical protein
VGCGPIITQQLNQSHYETQVLETVTSHQATNTELVLSLDVAFLPSSGLHAFIAGGHASLRCLCSEVLLLH